MINLEQYGYQPTQTLTPEQPQTKPGISNYISEAGGIAGGLLGSLLGGVGAVGGASLGAGLGQKLENKLTGKNDSALKEGLYSGIGEVAGLGLGKLATSLISKGASKGATSLIKKAYKPTDSIIKKSIFSSKDDFAKFVVKNNKTLGDDAIAALQTQYDDLALNSGAKVNVNKLYDSLIKEASKISKEGGIKKVKFADQIKAEAELLKSQLKGGKADVSAITMLRRSFDDNVNNFGADELTDVNLWMRNRLKNTIDTAVNSSAQKSNGQSITKISDQLSKSIAARNIIAKGLEKGSTRSPFGMGAIGGGVIGSGALGGAPGAIGGAAVGSALNNPALIGGTAGLLSKIGAKTAGGLGRTGGNIAGSLGQLIGNQETSPTQSQDLGQLGQDLTGQSENQMPTQLNQNSQTQLDQTQPTQQYDKNFFTQALFNDFAQTGGKNVSQILAVAKFLGVDQEQQKQTKLSDTAINKINDAQGALADLQNLNTTLSSNRGKTGPVIGKAQALIPGSQTQIIQADINRVKQKIGKALEGGVLRKEDEEKYKKILPTISDAPNVAQAKIQQLYTTLTRDIQNYVQLQQSVGSGGDQVGQLLQQLSQNQ